MTSETPNVSDNRVLDGPITHFNEERTDIYDMMFVAAEYAVENHIATKTHALSFFEDPQDGWAHGYSLNQFVWALSHVEMFGQAPTRWHQKILVRNKLVRKRTLNVAPYGTRTFLRLTAAGRQAFVFGSVEQAQKLHGVFLSDEVREEVLAHANADALMDFMLATQRDYEDLPSTWILDTGMYWDLLMHNNFKDIPRDLLSAP